MSPLAREFWIAVKEGPRMYFSPLVWLWRVVRKNAGTLGLLAFGGAVGWGAAAFVWTAATLACVLRMR